MRDHILQNFTKQLINSVINSGTAKVCLKSGDVWIKFRQLLKFLVVYVLKISEIVPKSANHIPKALKWGTISCSI